METSSDELSYTRPGDPPLQRWVMRGIENFSGRHRLLPIYRHWRDQVADSEERMWSRGLEMLAIRVDAEASKGWQASVVPDQPLIVIANHPFGIADGLALLALMEELGRPFRLILHSDIMRVPEMGRIGLPIDFSGTRDALRVNLETRAEVRRLLREGVAIAIFPAGAVATAEDPFGVAEELPWKKFVARLVRQYKAQVLPVYFEGQNSPLFHWVSRYSQTLRLSLLIHEFHRKVGATIRVFIGSSIAYEDVCATTSDESLIDELYLLVHRLAPGAASKPRAALLPRDRRERRQFPWDAPLAVQR